MSYIFIQMSFQTIHSILDLQPISRDSRSDVFRPRWLVPTIELVKYSFVLHHQHGRRASQELTMVQPTSRLYKNRFTAFMDLD